jgi:hypothetical protein
MLRYWQLLLYTLTEILSVLVVSVGVLKIILAGEKRMD